MGRSAEATLVPAVRKAGGLRTALLACTEVFNVRPVTREANVASNGRDAVFSPATDHVIDQGMKDQGMKR